MKLKMNSKRTRGAILLLLMAGLSFAAGQDKPAGEQAATPAAMAARKKADLQKLQNQKEKP